MFVATTHRDAFLTLAQKDSGVVICDQNMPGMTGVALMGKIRNLYPNLLRILMSGMGSTDDVASGVNEAGIHKYIAKDWTGDRIRSELREVLQRNTKYSV